MLSKSSYQIDFNLILTERGEVYTWGRGEYSQLGREPYTSSCHQPKPVPALQKPQQIATGSEHTLLLAGIVLHTVPD